MPSAAPVRVPNYINGIGPQHLYARRVIELALQHAGSRAAIQPIDLDMNQGRTMIEMASPASPIDVTWTMTDRQREVGGLLPVRIPIDRGLFGWRLLLVRRKELAQWQDLHSLAELAKRLAGQGHDWPDTAILRANGLRVSTTSVYETLFRMLTAGRIDYFPRSIQEIDGELEDNRFPELAIAPNLMLYYPTALYFFVSPHRPALAEELRRGLEAAIADGSFQRLHHEYFGHFVKAHPVAPERVFRLNNPLLPPQTPLQRRELWLQPGDAA